MAEGRKFTKVELLALELIIAVAQEKKVSPGSAVKDDITRALIAVDRIEAWMARHAGFNKINEKVINPRMQSAASKIESEPTLKQLMELHAEAVKNIK